VAGQSDAQLFVALAKAVEQSVSNFNMQNLANTAWAFVTKGQSDAKLFGVFARVAGQRVGNFHMQDLANSAWVLATVGQVRTTSTCRDR